MDIGILDLFFVALLIAAPALLFLSRKLQKNPEPRFAKFAKHFGLPAVYDKSSMPNRNNFIALPIDKAMVGNNIVELYAEVSAIPSKQKTYSMYSSQHHKFWTSYIEHRWDMAIVIAGSLRTAWDGQMTKYYETMINRCVIMKQKPPTANWNGTFLKD